MAFRILATLIGGGALLAGLGYWHLLALRGRVRANWSRVDTRLEERHAMVSRLADAQERASTRGDMPARLRSAIREAEAARGIPERAEAENQLTEVLRHLREPTENLARGSDDPELETLSAQICATESSIVAALTSYNLQVMAYNRRIHPFPWRWIARGFRPAEYLILDEIICGRSAGVSS